MEVQNVPLLHFHIASHYLNHFSFQSNIWSITLKDNIKNFIDISKPQVFPDFICYIYLYFIYLFIIINIIIIIISFSFGSLFQ